jgi:uncharacterized integral membrane protein
MIVIIPILLILVFFVGQNMGQTVPLKFVGDFNPPLIAWTLVVYVLGALSAVLIFFTRSLRSRNKKKEKTEDSAKNDTV